MGWHAPKLHDMVEITLAAMGQSGLPSSCSVTHKLSGSHAPSRGTIGGLALPMTCSTPDAQGQTSSLQLLTAQHP